MDTSDTRITFDDEGVCDNAVDFYENISPNCTLITEARALENIVQK